MNLRAYQVDAVRACMTAWKEHRRILLVLPTGAGKTITFAAIAKHVANRGHRVLILAHREELLEQARDKLSAAVGIEAQIEKAASYASRDASVIVASVQSLQGDRLASWPRDHFGLVIVDEAHHARADSYQMILDHFEARLLGVTATPDRSDKKALGTVFDAIAYELGLVDLIQQRYLARPIMRTLPLSVDLQGVKSSAGDYQAGGLGDRIEPYLTEIIGEARPYLTDRKTMVFCPLIETSKSFAEIATKAGLAARHIDGTSKDRRELLEWFSQAGPGSVLSCAMLLTEGFDEPSADCILNLRPTKSRVLYAQMVGRVLRTYPGKADALILDPLWMVGRHNLIKPASLVASTPNQAAEMADKQGDLLQIAAQAEHDQLQALKDALKEQSGRKSKLIDPFELGAMLNTLSIADYEPCFRWHEKPASRAQLDALSKAGVNTDFVRDRGHACAIMDALVSRQERGLATAKQVRMLVRFGHPTPDNATFREANAFLDSHFSKGNIRLISDVDPVEFTGRFP